MRELAGLWEAKLRFGPDVRGPLIIEHAGGEWRAEIAGRSTEAHRTGDTIVFELPDGRGGFRGQLETRRRRIVGHWIQAPTVASGSRYASPVTLERAPPLEDGWPVGTPEEVGTASGRPLTELFHALVAEPLQIRRYWMNLMPLGEAYLWYVIEYPYQGRMVRGFFAGGNGGQVVMGIPELDLVVAFYGGNYNDRVMFQTQEAARSRVRAAGDFGAVRPLTPGPLLH